MQVCYSGLYALYAEPEPSHLGAGAATLVLAVFGLMAGLVAQF
jgi:hypothetical protein